jgi:4-hydroxythreonine-4-phosphate dehydrogenase
MLELCTPVILLMSIVFLKKNLNSLPLHGIDKLDQILPGKINIHLWKRRS